MDNELKVNLHLINTPSINVKAVTAYLLNRLSLSEIKSKRSKSDKTKYKYTVVSGDNFEKIANKNRTRVQELTDNNPKHTSKNSFWRYFKLLQSDNGTSNCRVENSNSIKHCKTI